MIWLMMSAMIFLVIALDYLIVITVWKSMCKKELKGNEFGRLANGFRFVLRPDMFKLSGHTLTVCGNYTGVKPSFNNLIHIYSDEDDVVGLARKTKVENGKMTLKVYIPKKYNFTQIDEVSTVRRKYRLISEESGDITYPFKITKTFRDYAVSVYIVALGLLFLGFTIFYSEKSVLIFLFGLIFTALGFFMLIDSAKSSITFINEDRFLIESGFSLNEYSIDKLNFMVNKDSNGQMMLSIHKKGEAKKLVYFYQNSANFYDAVNVLNIAREKNMYISYYLPLLENRYYALYNSNGEIMYREVDEDYRVLHVYTNEFEVKDDGLKDVHTELRSLKELIKEVHEFDDVNDIAIHEGGQDDIGINKLIYTKMCKYGDYVG